MTTKPTELCIGAPEAFDGSYEKSQHWLHAVQFYLLVNKAVYVLRLTQVEVSVDLKD